MKYAIIENDTVTNIVISNRQMHANWVLVPAGMGIAIGDRYLNGLFYDADGTIRLTPEQEHATSRIETLEAEKKLLSAQVQALSDREEFLEDCIAEMAGVVYA